MGNTYNFDMVDNFKGLTLGLVKVIGSTKTNNPIYQNTKRLVGEDKNVK